MISDGHEGLKAAARKVLGASWRRCRVHFARNLLCRVSKSHQPMVSAALRTVYAEERREDAHNRWRDIAGSLRERFAGSPRG